MIQNMKEKNELDVSLICVIVYIYIEMYILITLFVYVVIYNKIQL